MSPFNHAWAVIGWTLGLGALAAGIWAIVFGAENYQRGIYAGFSYTDAETMPQQCWLITSP